MKSRAPLWQFGLLVLISIASIGEAGALPAGGVVSIYPDGSVAHPAGFLGSNLASPGAPARVRCRFGLPAQPPERRWLEEDALPVFESAWVSNAIRYTQKVLVTTLGTNDPSLEGPGARESVILVQICGHNTNSEYTCASAEFSVEVEGRRLELELREGLIYAPGTGKPVLVGALEIPAEGVVSARGAELKFQGNMPPGTTGSMTIKIPGALLEDPKAVTRLGDLEFEEELRRVKKAWKRAGPTPAERWPITWAAGTK